MNSLEIKEAIRAIGSAATAQNAPSKVLELAEISNCINEVLANEIFTIARKQFVQAINDRIGRLMELTESLDKEVAKNNQLSDKEKELMAKETTLRDKKKMLDALQVLEKELSGLDAGTVEKDIAALRGVIATNMQAYKTAIEQINSAVQLINDDLANTIAPSLNIAMSNLLKLETEQITALEKLSSESLQVDIVSFKEKYEALVTGYNNRVDKLQEITTGLRIIEKEHAAIIEQFRLHNLENDRIYGVLNSRGCNGIVQYVESLTNEIKERLLLYDKEIKTLISKRDELPVYKLHEMTVYQC